jgi:hypothetical protein
MKEKKAKLVPIIILLGSGIALGVFFHTRPDWTFWQLGKFLLAFIVSLVFGLFANAQIFLPILYNLPRSIYLYSSGRLRFAGILWQFIAPVSWMLGLAVFGFIDGFMGTSAVEFLSGSMGFNFGMGLSTIAILLALVTPSGLNDLKTDYEKNTFARFSKVQNMDGHTSKKGGNKTSAEQGNAESLSDFARRNEQIVFGFSDFLASNSHLIGDCSLLPYPKKTIHYAIASVIDEYQTKLENTTNQILREQCEKIIPTLKYLLTRLVNDWQEIEPEDKEAIAKLSQFDTFPDWALPLKLKYLDDERASIEACDVAIQVIKDKVEREKYQTEKTQSIAEIEAEKTIDGIVPPGEEQRIKSLEERIAEKLGDNADEAQIKAVAEKIRADFDKKGAEALARIKARQAKGQKF